MPATTDVLASPEEYLAREREAERKHEYSVEAELALSEVHHKVET